MSAPPGANCPASISPPMSRRACTARAVPDPAAEPDAGLLRASVVGDCDHTLRAARQLDERRQRAARGVERDVDAVGNDRPHALDEPFAVLVGSAPSERR